MNSGNPIEKWIKDVKKQSVQGEIRKTRKWMKKCSDPLLTLNATQNSEMASGWQLLRSWIISSVEKDESEKGVLMSWWWECQWAQQFWKM